MRLVAVPESGECKRNLTTSGLGQNEAASETKPEATQSPLRIRSDVLVQVKVLDDEVVANHQRPRSQ